MTLLAYIAIGIAFAALCTALGGAIAALAVEYAKFAYSFPDGHWMRGGFGLALPIIAIGGPLMGIWVWWEQRK